MGDQSRGMRWALSVTLSERAALAFFIFLIAGLAACAPVSKMPKIDANAAKAEREKQLALAARQYYGNTKRVHDIAYKVLKMNAALCGDNIRKGSGIFAVNKYFFKKDYRKPSEKALGIGDQIRVLGVAPGSAGHRAGVREGDNLVSLNGWKIPLGEEAMRKLGQKFKELSEKKDPGLILTVKRGDQYQSVNFKPEDVCNYGYGATEGSNVNAFADGERIRIEGGMMRFVENDVELATIIGHEIAHNMMDHIPKQQGNQVIGLVFDLLFAGLGVDTQGVFGRIGGQAFSQEFESEADYVGLYLTARAGYKIDDAPFFWRRMAMNFPGSIKTNHASSHPATPQRFLSLEKTVAEIKSKQAANKVLEPEKKDDSESKPVEREVPGN